MDIAKVILEGLTGIVNGIVAGSTIVMVVGILAASFLLNTETCTLEELKEFFKKENKKSKW